MVDARSARAEVVYLSMITNDLATAADFEGKMRSSSPDYILSVVIRRLCFWSINSYLPASDHSPGAGFMSPT